MRKSATLAGVAAALAVCLTPGDSRADVVFNTFTTPLHVHSGWAIGADYWHDWRVANRFTVSGSDYRLDGVAFMLWQYMTPVYVRVSLMEESAGHLVYSIGHADVNIDSDSSEPRQHLVETLSGTNIRLKKDTSYWIYIAPYSCEVVRAVWPHGNLGVLGRVFVSERYQETYLDDERLCAFTVYGTSIKPDVVPEPSSLLALLGGSGAMGGIMLRRKR